MPGLKFKNGKFVPRTDEEERRRAEYFAGAVEPKQVLGKPERFIKITMGQLDRLIPRLSKSPEVSIFLALCYENFRHRGAAFVWPADKFAKLGGFKLRTQQRIILQLEKAGLISVQRRHKALPIVRVLSVT